jgi:polysaccharide export outer membrane protein
MMTSAFVRRAVLVLSLAALAAPLFAQQPAPAQPAPAQQPKTPAPAPAAAAGVAVPADYVIGPEDVLAIVFWRDEKMNGEVTVRPDGKVSLPLVNDIQAAGLTPEQLRAALEKAAAKFLAEPTATVIVKAVNSRKVHIVGSVVRPNTYPLAGDMTVLQLIALAGGLLEYADAKNITVLRKESGSKDRPLKFNFKDVSRGKNLQQNVSLKPGDTVIVP